MKEFIRLFKAIPVKTGKKDKLSKSTITRTIKSGFILSETVIGNYTESELEKIIVLLEKEIGINPEQFNSSFHKSWNKVKTADIEQLVIEQIAHYLTTYGQEAVEEGLVDSEALILVGEVLKDVGVKDLKTKRLLDEDYVYIPVEKLKIPKIDIKEIKLVVIKGYTIAEFKEKLLKLLSSGIALKEETIKDVVAVAKQVELSNEEIEGIKNKEVKIALYDSLDKIPSNPVEFLRYIVYKATTKTLLIKNKELFELIKANKGNDSVKLFDKYEKEYGLKRLAEIFYRMKPLWLAFRTNKKLKTTINKIRKLAVKHHKPMPEDYLNGITSKIKNSQKIYIKKLEEELSKVNIFRKIRLAYALKFRTAEDVDSIMYKIRNGKSFATAFEFKRKAEAEKILNVVLESITKDLSKNVKGKKIYIPENIVYALPATEKQFTDILPSGSYIKIPKDMIVGVHWSNVNKNRIDLDLSLVSVNTKFGWDGDYRNAGRTILFSGDMTDAKEPDGATELFYVKKQEENALLLLLNYFNYNKEIEDAVPITLFVAKELVKELKMDYTVNPNNVLVRAVSNINQKQKIIGLLVSDVDESRFYFSETYIGKTITASNNDAFIQNSRKYLYDFYTNSISLNEILEKAGARVINRLGSDEKYDIDLSPEKLEKDTIISLLS